jgi:hypothetical protein
MARVIGLGTSSDEPGRLKRPRIAVAREPVAKGSALPEAPSR